MATRRPNLENLRSLGNFTQAFRWVVEFEKLPSALSSYEGGDGINFRAESSGIPKLNPQSSEVVIRGHKVKQPGIGEYENTITLTLIETVDNFVSNFIRQWRELCWQTEGGSTGITQSKEDVEGTLILTRLNNVDDPIWQYKLFGVFMETGEMGQDLDASTPDPFKPALTLSFDYFNDRAL